MKKLTKGEKISLNRRTHGQSHTPEYMAWRGMRKRCSNPKAKGYEYWGGRGISVCERWLNSFEAFYSDMGPKPEGSSLDRKDNDGDYEPSNCRWVNKKTSSLNRRSIRWIEIKGETKCLKDWARALKENPKGLYEKAKRRGISVEQMLGGKRVENGAI